MIQLFREKYMDADVKLSMRFYDIGHTEHVLGFGIVKHLMSP